MMRKGVVDLRTLSYVSFLKREMQECENLVLMCMDFRFHRQVSDLIAHAGYRDFDLVALPGASKSLNDELSRESVLTAIELAVEAHKVKRIIIVDHVDCRAYGGSAAFPNPMQEEEHHCVALRKASGVIRDRFGSLEVVQVYADWERVKQVE